MTITLRATSYSNITRFDIPIAKYPTDTLPGDLMIMQIVTAINKEPIPVIPGWTFLANHYANELSHFLFYKISNNEPEYYNIIRRKTGYNIITISSYYSTNNTVLNIEPASLEFKSNKRNQDKLQDYKITFNECFFVSSAGEQSNSVISFEVNETDIQYNKPFNPATITEASLISNDCVFLKWQGEETFDVEVSTDNESWKLTSIMQTTSLSGMIYDLKPSQTYYFRVVNYKYGQYKYSKSVSVETEDLILLRSISKNNVSIMNPRILVSPSPIVKGDLMIMQINYIGKLKINNISHGWKLLLHSNFESYGMYIYYKYATRKEPASYLINHSSSKSAKVLMAIAAFYSANKLPLKIQDSRIQNNQASKEIAFPELSLESNYALQIGICVRDLESSLKFWIGSTTLWDYEPKLRSTGIFSTINLKPIICNLGTSIAASIAIIEGEFKVVSPPNAPENLRISQAKGTTIRIF